MSGSPFDPNDFRAAMHRAADLVADYVESVGSRPVRPEIEPGDVLAQLPIAAPEDPEPLSALLDDYVRLVEPNVTHWNHPGFLAYFSSNGSEPGIVAELLTAGLSVNAMLWHTSPAATELELRVCDWLRDLLGLPPTFGGHINDTASISTFLGLAAARERAGEAIRERGLAGRDDLPPLAVYCSSEAHSSLDKACVALGLGTEALRRIEVDHAMRLDPAALRAAIARDLAAGRRPIAVVPTLGTTSTTSIDPVAEVADICAEHDLWLHVDAAWAGTAALCPELRAPFAGWERADSIVVNPHKWMFTPLDCSVLFVRDADRLRQAFAIVPEYLRTDPHPAKVDLMDYGVQLGRRFRALKLWFVLRAFGAEGLRQILRRHVALGREVARRIDADVRFERLAPVPFGVVCFRLVRPDLDEEGLTELNDRALTEINRHGSIFLSHTDVAGRRALRLAVSNLRTEAHHVEAAWTLLSAVADRLGATGPAPATGA